MIDCLPLTNSVFLFAFNIVLIIRKEYGTQVKQICLFKKYFDRTPFNIYKFYVWSSHLNVNDKNKIWYNYGRNFYLAEEIVKLSRISSQDIQLLLFLIQNGWLLFILSMTKLCEKKKLFFLYMKLIINSSKFSMKVKTRFVTKIYHRRRSIFIGFDWKLFHKYKAISIWFDGTIFNG